MAPVPRISRFGSALRRLVYTAVLYLLTPVIFYRLVFRGLRARGYFSRWFERFGFFPDPQISSSIWVHAVSVGEVNAAAPLIDALRQVENLVIEDQVVDFLLERAKVTDQPATFKDVMNFGA